MNRRILHRIVVIAGLLLVTLSVGTIGFSSIEHYPIFDAFYMTLITITTVGYQELHPLSQTGRVFNSFLILFGVSTMFFSVGAMTQTIIELELQDRYGKGRKRRMVQQMKNHSIVCGFGRVGRSAAQELQRAKVPFLVIDKNEQRVERATQAQMLAVAADATSDDCLRSVGIMHAQGFISALPTDAENVFVILSAKTLNPKLTVVTRAAEEGAEEKLRRAGADIVFSPYTMAGQRLAQSLVRPHVVRFMDFAAQRLGLDLSIEEFRVDLAGNEGVETVGALIARRDLGVILVGVRKQNGTMLFNPSPQTSIEKGDCVIAMGEPQHLRNLETLLSKGRPASARQPRFHSS